MAENNVPIQIGERDISQHIMEMSISLKKIESALEKLNENKLSIEDFDVMSSILRLIAANQLFQDVDVVDAYLQEQKKQKFVHLFFNCDENKSPYSMNILYNNLGYEDTLEGRKCLLERIHQEHQQQRIVIQSSNMKSVENAVTNGNPSDASQYLKYGCVVTINVCLK